MTISNDYVEVDAAWFSPEWLLDHPGFPLASDASDQTLAVAS
jgi:hypothetical protein